MSEDESEKQIESTAEASSETSSPPPPEKPRPTAITPALRRFLGPARTRHDRPESEETETVNEPPTVEREMPAVDKTPSPRRREKPAKESPSVPEEKGTESAEVATEVTETEAESSPPPRWLPIAIDWKLMRTIQMQYVALGFGVIFLLVATFYVGMKFPRWKQAIASSRKPKLPALATAKFPAGSAEELVEQALAAERVGNWQEAVERFIAAKHKNPSYRGILFRAAKLCYDRGDFDNADRLFDRAIAFGEQVDVSNYLRGLIAVGRSDLPAAQRFFEAAAAAEPFTPGYYYYWAEALRRDHHPTEAIRRYEQAAARSTNEQEATVCRFKVRMAQLEAGQTAELASEIEKKRGAGALPVDWLLTDAAIKIRGSDVVGAVPIINAAKEADESRLFSLFASCTTDMLFRDASRNHAVIEEACQVKATTAASVP